MRLCASTTHGGGEHCGKREIVQVEPDDIRRVLAQTRMPPPVTARQAASCAELLAEASLCSRPEQAVRSREPEAVEPSLCVR